MNIQQFNYILAVEKFRHFETAADHCFVSQSTLSTMIARFEEEIGIQIFDRSTKPVSTTMEGEIIIEQINKVVNEITQLEDTVSSIKGVEKGTLRIACIPTVAPFLLPLLLPVFTKQFPYLQLEVKEITTALMIEKLKLREIDIGILSTPIDDDSLHLEPVYNEDFVFFNPFFNTMKDWVTLNDINSQKFWLLEEDHCMTDQVTEWCDLKEGAKGEGMISFKAGSIDSLVRFVKSNKGQTLLPSLSVLDFTEEDMECVFRFKVPIPYREISLVVHPHFPKEKLLKNLINTIHQVIKDKDGVSVIL